LDFFDKWTPESAWVYGLILGDGHIHCSDKGGTIHFVGNEDTVNKYNALLGIDKKVSKGKVWLTYIYNKELALWFRRRGIQAKKSTSLIWPKDIKGDLLVHFLRGLADTDGSFSFCNREHKGRDYFRFGFSSATEEFAEKARNNFQCPHKLSSNVKKMNGKEFTQYSFQFSGLNDSIPALDRIYANAPLHLRNEERYNKYLCAKAMFKEYQLPCVLCSKPRHSGELCTEHMHDQKKKDWPCEGCSVLIHGLIPQFCCACIYRSIRLLKNPSLKTRVRRTPKPSIRFPIR
jgi:hypothetical protein